MITSKILSKQKKIKHGFFNRIGGKSSGIYKSLNCGPGSNDFKSKVKENLKIVKNRINKKQILIIRSSVLPGTNQKIKEICLLKS